MINKELTFIERRNVIYHFNTIARATLLQTNSATHNSFKLLQSEMVHIYS